MDPNPVAQAYDLLKQRRLALEDEVRQIDGAMAALEDVLRRAVPSTPSPSPNRRSVRTKLVALLEEERRDWSAAEIIAEYQQRGDPIQGADPANALRAAFADAKKQGWIVSTAVGRYQHAKWVEGEPSTATPENPQDVPSGTPQDQWVTVWPRAEAREVMP